MRALSALPSSCEPNGAQIAAAGLSEPAASTRPEGSKIIRKVGLLAGSRRPVASTGGPAEEARELQVADSGGSSAPARRPGPRLQVRLGGQLAGPLASHTY